MFRVVVLYEEEPAADAYAQHVEICRRVPGSTFRHGKVFGAPMGGPKIAHYAEFEFPDMDSFQQTVRSQAFADSGKDAAGMGIPLSVHFVELE